MNFETSSSIISSKLVSQTLSENNKIKNDNSKNITNELESKIINDTLTQELKGKKAKTMPSVLNMFNDSPLEIPSTLKKLTMSSNEVGNMKLLKIDYSNVNDPKEVEKVIGNLKILTSKISGLDKLSSFLDKVKLGYNITVNDYSSISDLGKIVSSKINDKSLNLSSKEKESLQTFLNEFNKLENYYKDFESSVDIYNKSVDEANSNLSGLSTELSKVLDSLKSKGIDKNMLEDVMKKWEKSGITIQEINDLQEGKLSPERSKQILDKFEELGVSKSDINKLMENYEEVLIAGTIKKEIDNYIKFSSEHKDKEPDFGSVLYSLYTKKMMSFLSNKEYIKDPKGLYKIMKDYDELNDKISQIYNSNMSNDDKKAKIMEEIKKYTSDGESVEVLEKMLTTNLRSLDFSKGAKIIGGTLEEGLGLVKSASKKDIDNIKNISSNAYKFLKNNPEFDNILNKCNESLGIVLSKGRNAFATKMLFQEQMNAINKLINSNMSSLTKVLNFQKQEYLRNIEESKNIISKNLEEMIDDFIKTFEDIMYNIDFSIDPLAANIVNLLESFRSIISTLEEDSKKIIETTMKAKLIDQNFIRTIKENNEKQESLNEKRELLNKLFMESKEVKFSQLPYKEKKAELNQVILKIMLHELSKL